MQDEELGALYITATTLALRPSEAIGLRWSDVEPLEAGVARIEQSVQHEEGRHQVRDRTKTNEPRTLPVVETLAALLREHRQRQRLARVAARRWEDSGLVFTNRTGGPIYEHYANRRLGRLLRAAGLPRVTMYQLRHTGATWALANGATLERIQEQLGHSSIVTTRRYAQVVDAGQRQAAASWDTALEGITLGLRGDSR